MTILQIGKKYPEMGTFTYSKIKDKYRYEDGWISAEKIFPLPYDLVELVIGRDGKVLDKRQPGWWDNHVWRSRWLKPKDKVILWKRLHEVDVVGDWEIDG